MVDFELYRIFVTVANEKNLTKASKLLNISQPAVTKRIKNLEDAIDVRLFERSRKGMVLTSEGEKLFRKINEAVFLLENAENMFKDAREINIGTRAMIFSRLFSPYILKFYEKYPEMKININYVKPSELKKDLLEQKIDIGIYSKRDEDLNDPNIGFIKLGEITDVFFVNSRYYKEMNKEFSKEDIKKETVYLSDPSSKRALNIIKCLKYSEEEKKNIKYIRNTVMLEILKFENGIGAISKEFIEKELADGTYNILKTNFSLPKEEYGVYYNKKNKFKELSNLIKMLEKEFNNNKKW